MDAHISTTWSENLTRVEDHDEALLFCVFSCDVIQGDAVGLLFAAQRVVASELFEPLWMLFECLAVGVGIVNLQQGIG